MRNLYYKRIESKGEKWMTEQGFSKYWIFLSKTEKQKDKPAPSGHIEKHKHNNGTKTFTRVVNIREKLAIPRWLTYKDPRVTTTTTTTGCLISLGSLCSLQFKTHESKEYMLCIKHIFLFTVFCCEQTGSYLALQTLLQNTSPNFIQRDSVFWHHLEDSVDLQFCTTS